MALLRGSTGPQPRLLEEESTVQPVHLAKACIHVIHFAHDIRTGDKSIDYLHPVDLVLRDLAEDEVPELLRLVAEVQHLAVLAHHRQLLLPHVDHQLRPQHGVVAGGHDAHLMEGGHNDFKLT